VGRLHVTSRSTRVQVEARPGAELEVTGGVVAEGDGGRTEVRADRGGARRLTVVCPPGTDVQIGSGSGAVRCGGPLGDVRISTRSGSVDVESAETLDVRTASGRVRVERCAGTVRVVAASADVAVERAGRVSLATISGDVEVEDTAHAEVKTVSGDVEVRGREGGSIDVHSVSGDVVVSVPAQRPPATRLASVSGRVRSDCPAGGHDGAVLVKTVSGNVEVRCR
jgi:hypothetical protein